MLAFVYKYACKRLDKTELIKWALRFISAPIPCNIHFDLISQLVLAIIKLNTPVKFTLM